MLAEFKHLDYEKFYKFRVQCKNTFAANSSSYSISYKQMAYNTSSIFCKDSAVLLSDTRPCLNVAHKSQFSAMKTLRDHSASSSLSFMI